MERKQIYGISAGAILLLWAILPMLSGQLARLAVFQHAPVESLIILIIGAASIYLSIKRIYKPLIIAGLVMLVLGGYKLFSAEIQLDNLLRYEFESGSTTDETGKRIEDMLAKFHHQWIWLIIALATWELIGVGILDYIKPSRKQPHGTE